MEIIEYFTEDEPDQAHWRDEIQRGDWRAAQFLHSLLEKNRLRALCGPRTRLLLAVKGEALAGFCTLAEKDDIPDTELAPWIGFVYTVPERRGNRLSGRLIEYACALAKADGFDRAYISTNEIGLYEKYGFAFLKTMKDTWGEDTRVYCREI